jgi:hypothetical protein
MIVRNVHTIPQFVTQRNYVLLQSQVCVSHVRANFIINLSGELQYVHVIILEVNKLRYEHVAMSQYESCTSSIITIQTCKTLLSQYNTCRNTTITIQNM